MVYYVYLFVSIHYMYAPVSLTAAWSWFLPPLVVVPGRGGHTMGDRECVNSEHGSIYICYIVIWFIIIIYNI